MEEAKNNKKEAPNNIVNKEEIKEKVQKKEIKKVKGNKKEEKRMIQQALGMIETRGLVAAIEAADIVIMNDEPTKIGEALMIAKNTRKIVWQNIIFALGVKAIVLIMGAMGMASMWAAVFADVGVALIAVLNAMRVLGYKPAKG